MLYNTVVDRYINNPMFCNKVFNMAPCTFDFYQLSY